MEGVERLLDLCEEAKGKHDIVLIHTSADLYDNLRKAISNRFKIAYNDASNKIRISRKFIVFVETDKPAVGISAGLVILFHVDERFDFQACVAPILNTNEAASLVMFAGRNILIQKDDILKMLDAQGKVNTDIVPAHPVNRMPIWVGYLAMVVTGIIAIIVTFLPFIEDFIRKLFF